MSIGGITVFSELLNSKRYYHNPISNYHASRPPCVNQSQFSTIMYADRIPSKTAQSKATEASSSVNMKTTQRGLAPNLKKHMWTRLRRILSNTTSYYRKSGMRPLKSPVEECKRLRSDQCCIAASMSYLTEFVDHG
jgi:hypothetical protein